MTDEALAPCATGCGVTDLRLVPHLRVQLSPPAQPWAMLRFCDLLCFSEWIDVELDAHGDPPARVFTNLGWVDSRAER